MRTRIVAVTTKPRPAANAFHLIMSILTCGLWIPVWIMCARGRKSTTRAPVQPGLSPGEQVRGVKWDGARDPGWLAEHVPGSAEYRTRHGG